MKSQERQNVESGYIDRIPQKKKRPRTLKGHQHKNQI